MPAKEPRPIVRVGETVKRGVECFEEQTPVLYNAMPQTPTPITPTSATASLFYDQAQENVELGGAGVTEVAAVIDDNKVTYTISSEFTQITGYYTFTLTVLFEDGQIRKKLWKYQVK